MLNKPFNEFSPQSRQWINTSNESLYLFVFLIVCGHFPGCFHEACHQINLFIQSLLAQLFILTNNYQFITGLLQYILSAWIISKMRQRVKGNCNFPHVFVSCKNPRSSSAHTNYRQRDMEIREQTDNCPTLRRLHALVVWNSHLQHKQSNPVIN